MCVGESVANPVWGSLSQWYKEEAFRWSAAVFGDLGLRIWKDLHMTRFCASSRGYFFDYRTVLEVASLERNLGCHRITAFLKWTRFQAAQKAKQQTPCPKHPVQMAA